MSNAPGSAAGVGVSRADHAIAERRTAALLLLLRSAGLPAPVREFRFDAVRRWRFDLAWPGARVAVELDGGEWLPHGGRHNTDADREKLNAAAAQGWRVLRFSGGQLDAAPGACVDLLAQALEGLR